MTAILHRLREDEPVVFRLLVLLSWLAPEPVPLDLVPLHPETVPAPLSEVAGDPAWFADAVLLLRRHDLAEVTDDDIRVHPGVAVVARLRSAGTPEDGRRWAAAAVRLLYAEVPASARRDPAGWADWPRYRPHVQAACEARRDLSLVPDEAAVLLLMLGRDALRDDDPGAARSLFVRAHGAIRDHLDEELAGAVAVDLVLGLRAAGAHDEAWQQGSGLLAEYRRALGEDHGRTLTLAHSLGADLNRLGRHQEAQQLYADTLRRCRRVLGPDDPRTLVCAVHLVRTLHRLGQQEQARQLGEDTLTRCRRTL
ncbi:MAG: tetratricopeptide repeat protein, partial [Actinoplanes sp.]